MTYPFIGARHFTPANRSKVDLIVIHDMEMPEANTTAEQCAQFFAGPNAPQASAHYCVDADSIVQCVREKDIAWHAPGANSNGIGIEHAGYARQTREEWQDDYSKAMLVLSANLTRELCSRWNIPIQFVDVGGLKGGVRGITTHAAVSQAFHKSDHTDPGPNFPMDVYLTLIKGYTTPPPKVRPMFDPALVLEPIVAELKASNGGVWLFASSGAVYAFGGAPVKGNVKGQPYFTGRFVATAEPHGDGFTIVSTSGERYDFP
jgi:N-acetyl-anhydromuramyl-L-alanine amidase AmpD